MNISGFATEFYPTDFAIDSQYISGVFHLRAGQILGVKLLQSGLGTSMLTKPDQTFFGFYQLSPPASPQ